MTPLRILLIATPLLTAVTSYPQTNNTSENLPPKLSYTILAYAAKNAANAVHFSFPWTVHKGYSLERNIKTIHESMQEFRAYLPEEDMERLDLCYNELELDPNKLGAGQPGEGELAVAKKFIQKTASMLQRLHPMYFKNAIVSVEAMKWLKEVNLD